MGIFLIGSVYLYQNYPANVRLGFARNVIELLLTVIELLDLRKKYLKKGCYIFNTVDPIESFYLSLRT
ncbi:hypothetical protein DOS84_07285 [Flavobacterium aquariorum]|uniref:Uncharacterized protein n=1 Tax=Flavobacterium aquariorum TaxID=2217670 RepID=A0A2W7TYG7_9FLAO|nr:hypothetical protein DOS84_07285 [Flavobacterium aquariorum]